MFSTLIMQGPVQPCKWGLKSRRDHLGGAWGRDCHHAPQLMDLTASSPSSPAPWAEGFCLHWRLTIPCPISPLTLSEQLLLPQSLLPTSPPSLSSWHSSPCFKIPSVTPLPGSPSPLSPLPRSQPSPLCVSTVPGLPALTVLCWKPLSCAFLFLLWGHPEV